MRQSMDAFGRKYFGMPPPNFWDVYYKNKFIYDYVEKFRDMRLQVKIFKKLDIRNRRPAFYARLCKRFKSWNFLLAFAESINVGFILSLSFFVNGSKFKISNIFVECTNELIPFPFFVCLYLRLLQIYLRLKNIVFWWICQLIQCKVVRNHSCWIPNIIPNWTKSRRINFFLLKSHLKKAAQKDT